MRLVFRILALTEGVTWVALISSMIVKYGLNGSPMGVTVSGWFHGMVFMLFVAAVLVCGVWFRWKWWVFLLGWVSAVIPFGTVVFDVWVERTNRLRARRSR